MWVDIITARALLSGSVVILFSSQLSLQLIVSTTYKVIIFEIDIVCTLFSPVFWEPIPKMWFIS